MRWISALLQIYRPEAIPLKLEVLYWFALGVVHASVSFIGGNITLCAVIWL